MMMMMQRESESPSRNDDYANSVQLYTICTEIQSELMSIHMCWEWADYKAGGRRKLGGGRVHEFPQQAQPSPGEPKAKTLSLNTWGLFWLGIRITKSVSTVVSYFC